MSDPNSIDASPRAGAWRASRVTRRTSAVVAVIALCAAGAALGAGGAKVWQARQPQRVMLLQPSGIADLRDDTTVAVKGEVKEVYGNKFVIADASGRALVDLGPRGEDRQSVVAGETVTAQGRFDRGVVHAQLVAHADGRADAFGPPPPKGPKGPPKGAKDRAGDLPPPPAPDEPADQPMKAPRG